jgi:phage-related protein
MVPRQRVVVATAKKKSRKILSKMNKLTVELFTEARGKSPVKDFIEKCQVNQRVKILRLLKYLEEFGTVTAIPNTKKLTGTPLWELRILGKDNLRLIYASVGRNRISVLHFFAKKKPKTPARDLRIALDRLKLVLDS